MISGRLQSDASIANMLWLCTDDLSESGVSNLEQVGVSREVINAYQVRWMSRSGLERFKAALGPRDDELRKTLFEMSLLKRRNTDNLFIERMGYVVNFPTEFGVKVLSFSVDASGGYLTSTTKGSIALDQLPHNPACLVLCGNIIEGLVIQSRGYAAVVSRQFDASYLNTQTRPLTVASRLLIGWDDKLRRQYSSKFRRLRGVRCDLSSRPISHFIHDRDWDGLEKMLEACASSG